MNGCTKEQTETAKLIVHFRNVANAPKNSFHFSVIPSHWSRDGPSPLMFSIFVLFILFMRSTCVGHISLE